MAAYISPSKTTLNLVKSVRTILKSPHSCCYFSTKSNTGVEDGKEEKEKFRVYQIEGLEPMEQRSSRRSNKKRIPPPRFRAMPTDQDWTEVWPTASTFNWSVVPFPVRQGFIESSIENEGVVPGKYANLELMKIPNFLHLTPAHITKHCEALKPFCTPWPEALDTDEKCRQHFPLEQVTSDYVSASPVIRDPRARVAKIKFHVSDLDLDYHAKDKFIRLMGQNYNPSTEEVELEADRCPLKAQNMDFLHFVLTAVYFESWKTEPWESMKQLEDMEKYFWDINKSRQSLMTLLKTIKDSEADSTGSRLDYLPDDVTNEDIVCDLPQVQQYKGAVSDLFNEGENHDTLTRYKESVINVLGLKSDL